MNWTHPDAAFSPYYQVPDGLLGEPCRHYPRRERIGPTSRKRCFMILVDSCGWCGRILRNAGPDDLTWREYDWVRRRNGGFPQ